MPRKYRRFKLLRGALKLSFSGSYALTGRRMTLTFEKLRVRLFWFLTIPLDIREDRVASFGAPRGYSTNAGEGRGVRGLVERFRGGRKNTKTFEKRPNVYAWCYADEGVCVAQGTSGNIAVWANAFCLVPPDARGEADVRDTGLESLYGAR